MRLRPRGLREADVEKTWLELIKRELSSKLVGMPLGTRGELTIVEVSMMSANGVYRVALEFRPFLAKDAMRDPRSWKGISSKIAGYLGVPSTSVGDVFIYRDFLCFTLRGWRP